MSNQNICNICGANYEYIAGRWKCPACGAYKAEELSNEEVTLLYNAAQKLRLCDFNEAEIEYADIIDKFPNNPEGYWGRLLARYGIKYEEDFDGRKIPTCYAASIKSVFGDPDYEKAMSLFPKADRAYYKAQAEYIERVRKEWIDKASKEEPYDIFLCYKDSDLAGGIERTPDSIAAQDLYIHLTEQGYRVFYSRESLRDKAGEKYEPYIFNALTTAKVMLVYGSKPEYITSTWLKNEWTRYIKRMQAGEKLQNSLLVACDGFSPDLLPRSLSSRQCFDATKRSFYIDLDKALKKAVNDSFHATTPTFIYKNDNYFEKNEEDEDYEFDEENEENDTDFEIGMGDEEEDSQEYKVLEFTDDDFEENAKKKTPLPLLFIFLALLVITPIVWLSYFSIKQPDSNKNTTSTSVSEEKITITFVTETGTVIKRLTTPKGENVNLKYIPSVPEKPGYSGKWSVTDFTKVSKDTTVTPVYTVKYYSISYVLNGGTNNKLNPSSYSINTDAFLVLYSPTHSNYSFGGWYLDSDYETKVEYIDTSKLKNLTLYAKWETTTTEPETYTVTYNLNGGTNNPLNPSAFEANSGNITLADPTREGYTFKGWYSDSGFSTKVTAIDTSDPRNIYLYAKWEAVTTEPETYTVTYFLNGGTNDPSNPSGYSVNPGNITLADPARLGYTFKGWYSDSGFSSKVTTINTNNPKNITLYAKWEIINYTITYVLNGGTNNSSNPESYTVESINVAFADPTKTGYGFGGWYSDSGFNTKVTIIDTSDPRNIYLYAKWEAVTTEPETYTVTYFLNGGTNNVSNPSAFETNSGNITLADPTRKGFAFRGWYSDPGATTKVTIINTNNPKDITLYARWEIIDYTITYILNGGTNSSSNPTSYNVHSGSITLADPTRSGYLFKGWYSDSGFNTKVTAIDTSKLTSITLYAKWKKFPFTYTINNGEATITGYSSGDEVVIPSEIEGVPVTAIGEKAFYDERSIKSVTIPDSVTTIGQEAFYNCDVLTSVTIPDSVQTIGQSAFSGCDALTNVTIGNNVQTIGQSAFSYCSALTSITIGNSVQTIGDYAFYNCDALTSVTIGNSVQTIGQEAFSDCDALTSVTIPDSVISIGERAFYSCIRLRSITLGKNLFIIGSSAFSGCYSLVEVYNLSDALYISVGSNDNGYVGYYALGVHTSKSSPSFIRVEDDGFIFYERGYTRYLLGYVGNETEITLPESCGGKDYEVYKYAFYDCDKLTSITISESVREIGDYAFSGCDNLTDITISKTVRKIGPYAFSSCSSLSEIVFEDPAIWYYSSYSGGTNGTTIPEANLSTPSVAAVIIKNLLKYYLFKNSII